MTNKEITDEYKKLFILNMEIAGETENNDSYSNVEKILEDEENKNLLDDVIEKDAPLEVFIGSCIMCILRDMYGLDTLASFSTEKLNECFHAIYDIYLEKPTRKFVTSRGIPRLSNFDELFVKIVRVKRNSNEEN